MLLEITIILFLLLGYSVYTTSLSKGIFTFVLLLLGGFLIEYMGLHIHSSVGFVYTFHIPGIHIYDVPLSIILSWAVCFYLFYSVTNSFLVYLHEPKPERKNTNYLSILPLIAIDAFLGTGLDSLADPVSVHDHLWTYLTGGNYYGVPFSNFIAWFLAIGLFSLILRSIDYFYSSKTLKRKFVYIFPILIYLCAIFLYTHFSIQYHLTGVTLMGFSMALLIIIATVGILRHK